MHPSKTGASQGEALVRVIGTLGLAAAIINITIGGGIFRLPANVAGSLGAAAPIAYLVCAVAMGLIVLCIADAGSRVSLTGGPYAYVGTAFRGPLTPLARRSLGEGGLARRSLGEGGLARLGVSGVVPWLACGVIVWLLTGLTAEEWIGFGVCLVAASLVYAATSGRRASVGNPGAR